MGEPPRRLKPAPEQEALGGLQASALLIVPFRSRDTALWPAHNTLSKRLLC